MSHRLNDLCDYYGKSLEHHYAVSDSYAYAEIPPKYLKNGADKHIKNSLLVLNKGRWE